MAAGVDSVPQRRDRSWYVKGVGRGPGRGYSAQRKFVKQDGKYLDVDPVMTSGGNMGFFSSAKSPKSDDDDSSDAESEVDSDEEDVVG